MSNLDPSAPVGTIVAADLDGVDSLDGRPVVFVRAADGWVAVDDVCPHASCSFADDGEVADDAITLICNCHGSEFDLRDGSVLLGPASMPLTVTPIEQTGRKPT